MIRIKQALKVGFQHLVFEDNYDTGTGDHYSLRQMCDQFYIRGTFSPFFTFFYEGPLHYISLLCFVLDALLMLFVPCCG